MTSSQPVEILLVEDNPSDLELALHALKSNNLANHIQIAGNGKEALDFIFGASGQNGNVVNRPRAVLLDLKLPDMSGLDVLRQIKSHPSAKSIPVVMLTSSGEDRDLKAAYELGANSYIVKPVDFDQFTSSIRDAGMYWLILNVPPAP